MITMQEMIEHFKPILSRAEDRKETSEGGLAKEIKVQSDK